MMLPEGHPMRRKHEAPRHGEPDAHGVRATGDVYGDRELYVRRFAHSTDRWSRARAAAWHVVLFTAWTLLAFLTGYFFGKGW